MKKNDKFYKHAKGFTWERGKSGKIEFENIDDLLGVLDMAYGAASTPKGMSSELAKTIALELYELCDGQASDALVELYKVITEKQKTNNNELKVVFKACSDTVSQTKGHIGPFINPNQKTNQNSGSEKTKKSSNTTSKK